MLGNTVVCLEIWRNAGKYSIIVWKYSIIVLEIWHNAMKYSIIVWKYSIIVWKYSMLLGNTACCLEIQILFVIAIFQDCIEMQMFWATFNCK